MFKRIKYRKSDEANNHKKLSNIGPRHSALYFVSLSLFLDSFTAYDGSEKERRPAKDASWVYRLHLYASV